MTADKTPGQGAGRNVLGIDPGRRKCGLAVVSGSKEVKARKVRAIADVPGEVDRLIREYGVGRIVLGSGTGAEAVASVLRKVLSRHEEVDLVQAPEKDTTLRARKLYFEANPARGWRRLLPPGMRVPPESYDDFSAAIIALDFLAREETGAENRDAR